MFIRSKDKRKAIKKSLSSLLPFTSDLRRPSMFSTSSIENISQTTVSSLSPKTKTTLKLESKGNQIGKRSSESDASKLSQTLATVLEEFDPPKQSNENDNSLMYGNSYAIQDEVCGRPNDDIDSINERNVNFYGTESSNDADLNLNNVKNDGNTVFICHM